MLKFAGVAAILLMSGAASAQRSDEITIGDVPGTDGRWQYGQAVVAAPAATVQRWLDDVAAWPTRYPDVTWAQSLGTGADGQRLVRFRSSIIGRAMTLHMREQPGRITYDGEGKDVTTHGKIFVEKLDGTHTRVVLQSTADLHGAAGVFASESMKRDRTTRKIRSDLNALIRLSRAPSE